MKFKENFIKKYLESNDTTAVMDTSILIDCLYKFQQYSSNKQSTRKLYSDYTKMINAILEIDKITLCDRILREVYGVLYYKICKQDQNCFDNILEGFKLNHPNITISGIATDIQNNVTLKGSAKYPVKSKDWPTEIIKGIHQDMEENHHKKLAKYRSQNGKEPLDDGDIEILIYCAYLISKEKKKVLFFTNDKGIADFAESIYSEIKDLTIVSQFED